MPPPDEILDLVRRALEEDGAYRDLTTLAVVPAEARGAGRIVAGSEGVLAGVAYAEAAFLACDATASLDWLRRDGDRLQPGAEVLRCRGSARGLLAAERTALNFLQQLSGVATATARVVAAAGEVAVLDTRKTAPGLRAAQRAAVRAGGGRNHRFNLADQLLLKENHFALSGLGLRATVERARGAAAGRVVGAEARSVEEALEALDGGADYVLLDNFRPEALAAAVAAIRARHPRAVLEASGGFGARNVAVLRGSGLDRVSIGALTHSAPALDLAFYLSPVSEDAPAAESAAAPTGGGPGRSARQE